MTIRIKRETTGIIDTVAELSGVDLSLCYQCRKCTSGCPVAGYADTPPSEIIRRLHLGAGDEILESDIVWLCASCETCFARCPMGIDIASVMDTLRIRAREKKIPAPEGNMPLFNRAFLETIRIFGRSYDMAMIAAYKIGTMSFMKDTEKFPAMLWKGKIALMPPRGADRNIVRRIFSRLRSAKKGT